MRKILVCGGFSLLLLLVSLTNWGGLSWSALIGVEFPAVLFYKSVPQLLAIAFVLIASLRFSHRALAASALQAMHIGSAALMMLSFGLLVFCKQVFAGGSTLVVCLIGSVGLGISCGGMLLLWGRLVGALSQTEAMKTTLASMVAYVVFYALFSILDIVGQCVLFALAILLSTVFYCLCVRLDPRGSDMQQACSAKQTDSEEGSGKRPAALPPVIAALKSPLVCVVAVVFSFAFIRSTALMGLENKDLVNQLGNLFVAVMAAGLYFFWFAPARQKSEARHIDIMRLYRALFPVIATIALGMPFFNSTLLLIAAAILHTLFFGILAFIVVASSDLAKSFSCNPRLVFGLLCGSAYLSIAISTLIAYFIYWNRVLDAATVSVCALAVMYALSMAYAAVQKAVRKDSPGGKDEGVTPDGTSSLSATTLTDDIAERCESLSIRYNLTEREKDVLLHLVKGYSIRGISQQLFVTENTVRTHSKNLYRKLDVHSKNEVIDLLDSI